MTPTDPTTIRADLLTARAAADVPGTTPDGLRQCIRALAGHLDDLLHERDARAITLPAPAPEESSQ